MGVPPRNVTLHTGATSRSKVFDVDGGDEQRLSELLASDAGRRRV